MTEIENELDNSTRFPVERNKNMLDLTNPPTLIDFYETSYSINFERAVLAVKEGHLNRYIGNGNTINNLYETPLMCFITEREYNHIKWALEKGADPNLPTIWTKKYIDPAQVKYPEDCDLDSPVHFPLEEALEKGDMKIVEMLLEAGADWSYVKLEETLWGVAKFTKSVQSAKLLLSKGSKIITKSGTSILHTMRENEWSGSQLYDIFGTAVDDQYFCKWCRKVGYVMRGDPCSKTLDVFICGLCGKYNRSRF